MCLSWPLTAARCSPIAFSISERHEKSICNHYELVYLPMKIHMATQEVNQPVTVPHKILN